MSEYLGGRIRIIEADITTLQVDAIVNAANKALCGGGGVDGSIHRAAGPELLAECRTLGGAQTGEARITGGYNLPAKHVIHAVGPVWEGGHRAEDVYLVTCYLNSLAQLTENNLSSIAFPAISTGAYRFPLERATRLAIQTIHSALLETPSIELVVFCCFGQTDLRMYRKLASELIGSGTDRA